MHPYISVALFIAFASLLAFVMLLIPKFIAPFVASRAKITSYECGFDKPDFTDKVFNIRFYLVAILFIIFDLEIVFLLPWAVALKQIGLFGFTSMMVFLSILAVGFIYELFVGALEWD